jgi:hypothetical protein
MNDQMKEKLAEYLRNTVEEARHSSPEDREFLEQYVQWLQDSTGVEIWG